MLIALGVVFVFSLLVFFAIALLFPEWVGITGKKAEEIMKHQESRQPEAEEPPQK